MTPALADVHKALRRELSLLPGIVGGVAAGDRRRSARIGRHAAGWIGAWLLRMSPFAVIAIVASPAVLALSQVVSHLGCIHATYEECVAMIDVQCPACGATSTQTDRGATGWHCPCGRAYVLRRCSACGAVSHVDAGQRSGEIWNCAWCQEPNEGYSIAKDPATATLAELAGAGSHGLGLGQEKPQQAPVLIVTTNEIPGYRIIQVHGDVFGLIVRARNYFSNLGAQFRTLAGGEVAGYTRLLTDSRNQARARMWSEARARGANAVVAMRFDCNEIGGIMSEIAAYGTAVTAEPLDAPDAAQQARAWLEHPSAADQ
jgi:uncharacterized protein YbjQ (UPF0145 family)